MEKLETENYNMILIENQRKCQLYHQRNNESQIMQQSKLAYSPLEKAF